MEADDADRWDVKPNSIVLLTGCKYLFLSSLFLPILPGLLSYRVNGTKSSRN